MAISQAEGGTRSGLLWEVERLLNELSKERERETSTLPQILLMENVPEVIGAGNVEHFNQWLAKLESLGYSNFFQILNAKDYGIPQNRRRCFMVSLLGNFAYDFPLKLDLKYRLKDFLESKVDEKYYLSDKMVSYITATNEKWTGNNNGAIVNRSTACTINTAPGSRRCDASNYVSNELEENANLQKLGNYGNGHHAKDVYAITGVAPTIVTGNHGSGQAIAEGGVMIKENNSIGYKIANVGDGVNIANRMKHQRGNVQKGSIQTLKAEMEIAVVVDEQDSD